MSTIELGVKTKLKVGTTSAGPKVDMTGIAIGVDGLNRAIAGQSTPAAGSGVIAGQLSNFDNHDFAISVPSDATHDPIWRAQNGKRVWCEYAPEGEGSGSPRLRFEAVVQVSLAFTVHPDNVRWTVQFFVDGKPTEDTY